VDNALAMPSQNMLGDTYASSPMRMNPNIAAQGDNIRLQALLNQAAKSYPFIAQHNPILRNGVGEGYLETWPSGEGGAPDSMGRDTRPKHFPMSRLGIEIRRPNDVTHHDIAGEVLHIDPYANTVRDNLIKLLTSSQLQTLKANANDYQMTLDQGRSEDDAIRNAADSALRGYTFGQWPEEVNREMQYSPIQTGLLEALKNYMKTGKK